MEDDLEVVWKGPANPRQNEGSLFPRQRQSVGLAHFLFRGDAVVRKVKLVGFIQIGAGQTDFNLAANFSAGWKHREQPGQWQFGKERSIASQHRKKECRDEACRAGKCYHIASG